LAHDFQEKNLFGIYYIFLPINICSPSPPEQKGNESSKRNSTIVMHLA
jgi:hypothetical protein